MDVRRILPAAAGVTGAAFLVAACIRGPWDLLGSLDFLPGVTVDFKTVYLPQAQHLFSEPGSLHPRWFYPPLFAVLLQPFTWLPANTAAALWIVLELSLCVCLGRFVFVEFRRTEGRRLAALGAFGLVITSLPVIHTLKWGQVSLLVTVGVLWSLRTPGATGAGSVMGALGGIKGYPPVYALAWVVRRRWKPVLVAAAVMVLMGLVLPWILLSGEVTRIFFARFLGMSRAFGEGPISGAQGVRGLIDAWFYSRAHFGLPPGHDPWLFSLGGLVRLGLFAVLAAGLLAGTVLRIRRLAARDPVSIALVLTTVTLCLSPAWHHYFAFLPFAVAVLWARSTGPTTAVLALAPWTLTAVPVLALPFAPQVFHWYSSLGGTTVAALLVWAGLMRLPAGETDLDMLTP